MITNVDVLARITDCERRVIDKLNAVTLRQRMAIASIAYIVAVGSGAVIVALLVRVWH